MSRAYMSGMLQTFRGAQLTCLTVPSGPASSKGGSSLGMERGGGVVWDGPATASFGGWEATAPAPVSKAHSESWQACVIWWT